MSGTKPRARFIMAKPEQFIGKVMWNPSVPSVPPVSHLGATKLPRGKAKEKFRGAILKSIKKEGIRNPVIGYMVDEGILLQYGASRLRAARELNVLVPVIVLDYAEKCKWAREVTNENFARFFTDVPKVFEIREANELYHSRHIHHSYFIAKRDRENEKYSYDPAGVAWLGDDPEGVIDDELRFVKADMEKEDDS